MDHENTAQEVPHSIDPAMLCEHCPFTPQNAEGNGQQRAAEKALGASLKTQEIDRQMPLPFEDQFEGELGDEWLPENEPESDEPKSFDDLTHRLALAYLMHEENKAGNERLPLADPAHKDVLNIKAEVERLEQRAEREGAQGAIVADQPDPNRVAALASPANDGLKSSAARMDTSTMIKGVDGRSAQEQKGTARQESQHLAETPLREVTKDVRGADRERS